MFTEKIMVENGMMVDRNGFYLGSLSEDGQEVSINGWNVKISEGKIICHSERVASHKTEVRHYEYDVEDGNIALICNSTEWDAYVISNDLRRFFFRQGIKDVRRVSPNQEFVAEWDDDGFHVTTDGAVKITENPFNGRWLGGDPDFDMIVDEGEGGGHQAAEFVSVTGASWALVKSTKYDTFLYTLENNLTSLIPILSTYLKKNA